MKNLKFFIYLSAIVAALACAAFLNALNEPLAAGVMLAIAFTMLCVRDVRDTLGREPRQ